MLKIYADKQERQLLVDELTELGKQLVNKQKTPPETIKWRLILVKSWSNKSIGEGSLKMSKGSKPRPFDKSKFDTNFDKIFGKRKGNVVGKISSTQKKTSNLPPKK